MSEENVELVRRSYEAWDRQEFDPDLTAELWHPDSEFIPAMAGTIEGRIYRGPEGIRAYWDELYQSFSEVTLEDREYRDLGDRVLALYRLNVRGHDSGIAIDQPAGALYTVRDGMFLRAQSYLSRKEALEAAGLTD